MSVSRQHAIVIGGGIAGLLAARVLADHFEQVTVIERDSYPQEPGHRSGTPQDRQVHTMLLRGQRTLEALFPGLEKKLLAQGAIQRDYGSESLYYYGGRCPQLAPALRGWSCSRWLLEWQIRQELSSRIEMKEGYEVVHLLYDQRVVCGVQIQKRSSDPDSSVVDLHGELVVDASGVSSRAPQWIKELGYEPPQETVVNPQLAYATRFYALPTHDDQARLKGIAVQGTGQNRRGGSLMEIEGKRWSVVLAGAGKDIPPTDEEGYLAFAKSLPDPALFNAIKEAAPVSSIYGYRRTENRLRHFKQMPQGFIVVGDAACAFNPIYGQGMTVAALEALALDSCLRKHKGHKGFSRLFQRNVERVIAGPWRLAAGSDSRATGGSGTGGFSRWYIESVIALLPHDQSILLTFLKVVHMLRSPLALFHPVIIAKILRRRLIVI